MSLPHEQSLSHEQSTFDVDAIRRCFPALSTGTAYFDGPGGSQTPTAVADAIRDAMLRPLANRGHNTTAERNAEEIVVQCRLALGDLLNADPDEVIFGRSMTALTFDLSRTLSAQWSPGDEIVVTRLDHDANVRPWVIAAANAGAVVRWVDFDPETSELPVQKIEAQLSERTRLVAVTAASNLIGTMPDVRTIAARAHAAGALLYVDGVHYTAHSTVDFRDLGADFFACSPYKFLGPHCGVVVGKRDLLAELRPGKLLPATDRVPERFELGTLPYELMAGTTAAVDFLAGMTSAPGSRRARLVAAMSALEHHEDALRQRIEAGLRQLPAVTIHSRAARRTPTLLITVAGHDSAAISGALAQHDINAPAGSFYAYEASRFLGLGEAGGVRIGLAPYNSADDVDLLIRVLASILKHVV
ncbi:cysteine desulfurase-like protein [Mycobacterium sp. AZCC_0083]|uniref:cysteine desulfurase-like protein n=1 Tax=Mycobacterium sp. AZCC_0083 TaxID=2735882 RepID=UPI00161141EC|nr:cysteine desulfurase-like protein [Mycobacterium sp. AZCC_0083]MBB5162970.1 cysteine desulfurase family protein (TIGR01976 family) [Mycobacterium sp. AZCC_0083]